MDGADRLLCFGHRGARGHEPENTLRSVRRAIEMGVDGVEIDVHAVEGRLVVIHDDTVDRTTKGHGTLQALGLAGLRELDAGEGERIPFLEEVLDVVADRVAVNIELKGPGTACLVLPVLKRYLAEGWPPERLVLSSFRVRELRVLAGGRVPLGLLFRRAPVDFVRRARELGAVSVHPHRHFTTRRLVARAHRNHLCVLPYTVNDPAEIARMRRIGVDGVFTDFPERVVGARVTGVCRSGDSPPKHDRILL